jgi:DNA modification methylase
MKPYYEDESVTIYHASCEDVLDFVGGFDLMLTDPPYGINKWNHTGGNSITEEEADKINQWDILPSIELLTKLVATSKYSIVWGGNYLCGPLGAWRTPFVWDKAIRGMHFADGELAWTNFDFGSLRIFNLAASASDARGNRKHPTQKPVQLMRWCIQQARGVQTVFDPFLGSGTTLRAAKDLGLKAVGVEIEEQYCEVAANRMAQGSLFESFL